MRKLTEQQIKDLAKKYADDNYYVLNSPSDEVASSFEAGYKAALADSGLRLNEDQ
jgi:hypothetical protein